MPDPAPLSTGSGLRAQAGNLAVLLIGAGFVLAAAVGLDPGTPRRLGPGAFPMLAGGAVMALALASLLVDLRKPRAAAAADGAALLAVAGAVATFAGLVPLAGVLPATFAAALVASLGTRRPGRIWRLALAAVLTAGAWFLFLHLLQVPFVALRGF